MRKPAVFFEFALALAAILVPGVGAAAEQDSRAEPIKINKCQIINESGSHKLTHNISATGAEGLGCLVIRANFVTIDLGGFRISGPRGASTGIQTDGAIEGTAVRNGSITGFARGVSLGPVENSVVEHLRVSGGSETGITASGIVKDNIALFWGEVGISASGTVTGNYVARNQTTGMNVSGTVISNTAVFNGVGLDVFCPANVTNNTAVDNSSANLVLRNDGCNNTNNVTP
jgi:hypothetical protein